MRAKRAAERQEAEELLIGGFPVFVAAFSRDPTFGKRAQLDTHLRTIARRRELGSARAAVSDSTFLDALYETLRAWGIGSRGSRLCERGQFVASLEEREAEITALEPTSLEDAHLDVAGVSARLLALMQAMRLVDNKSALVPSTKALHHLFPDLVVPMDRAYTRRFFGWNEVAFQNQQPQCFEHAFGAFHRIACRTNPSQYVGEGWNSSSKKVLDNALVGVFVVANRFCG